MSAAGFDIRIPLGWLFGVLGLLLIGWGALSPAEIYQRSLGMNVNLIWGSVMLIFGIVCLLLARRAVRK